MPRLPVSLAAAALLLGGCAAAGDPAADPGSPSPTSPTASPPPTTASASPTSPSPETTTRSPQPPATFDPAVAYETVETLAGGIGPREAASAAFLEAADLVEDRLVSLGYSVERRPVDLPAGDSWGVPVPAGQSLSLVATPPGFDAVAPHRVVAAHLDTVAVAPGAEDNASGIGVMLELARMAVEERPSVPVVIIAFGAEEPRGRGDDMHHFGSQAYVRDLADEQRAAIVGMLALDRVGVPTDVLPVCHGGRSPDTVRDQLLAAANRLGIPAQACENRASDHWSFEKAGVAVARLGSVPYAGYHSPQDVPSVVDPVQLDRAGRTAWEWLQAAA
ncbi:MAG TPA: M28 family peptidase [Jiangellales bacterium]|nr:M28 family peptidase [Jiangellales bacterium]